MAVMKYAGSLVRPAPTIRVISRLSFRYSKTGADVAVLAGLDHRPGALGPFQRRPDLAVPGVQCLDSALCRCRKPIAPGALALVFVINREIEREIRRHRATGVDDCLRVGVVPGLAPVVRPRLDLA